MLIVVVFAGCLQAPDPPAEPPSPEQPSDSVKRFLSDGTLLSLPAVKASPQYVYTGTEFVGQEPNIGITSSGTIFTTAWEATLRSQDDGRTWESVHTYCMFQGQYCEPSWDPSLWVDAATDRLFVNHMYFREEDPQVGPQEVEVTTGCFTMLWSDDDGESWTQRDMACMTPRVDHQKIVTGPPGPEPNPWTTSMSYPSVVYTCYNDRTQTEIGGEPQTSCIMSYDGGLSYPWKTAAFDGSTDCAGTAGHPAVAPDGTIVVPAAYKCGPEIAVSADSGMTWTVRSVPRGDGVTETIDPDIAFDADGTMYIMWRDGDHMARLARSEDLGQTWTGPWNITTPGLSSTRFHALSAGDDGRVAMAYLGTDASRGTQWTDEGGEGHTWAGLPDDAPPTSRWHLYIVTLEDNGTEDPAFTSHQVTPDEDPVQIGCTGVWGGPRNCRNLMDFIDTAMAPDGTFYVSYTEGCTVRRECVGDPEADETDSRDGETAVAWLDGWSLLD